MAMTDEERARLAFYRERDFIFLSEERDIQIVEHLLKRSERHNSVLNALLSFCGIIIAALTILISSTDSALYPSTTIELAIFSVAILVFFLAGFLAVYALNYRRFRYHVTADENMYRLRRELAVKFSLMNITGTMIYLGFALFLAFFLYKLWGA